MRGRDLWLVGLEAEIWHCGQGKRFDLEVGRGLVWIQEWCLGKGQSPLCWGIAMDEAMLELPVLGTLCQLPSSNQRRMLAIVVPPRQNAKKIRRSAKLK